MPHDTLLNRIALILTAVGASVLAACGGGSQALGGIEGSGIAPPSPAAVTIVGPITGFGSIIVDGIEFETSGAQIHIDEESGTESRLRIGQIVTIKGVLNANGSTGTANDVSFVSDARGAVEEVDTANKTFVVLGQTVRVTADTVFDERLPGSGISVLQSGAKVQVSGFPTAAGEIEATRIDDASANPVLQIHGKVKSLDETSRTFRVGKQTVDYSAATISGTLASDRVVTVQGSTKSASGALLATRITVESAGDPRTNASPGNGNGASGGTGAQQGKVGQVEGLITQFTSNSDFVVGSQRVTTDASTQFNLHGVSLALDVAVKVRGTLTTSGVLQASKVESKKKSASAVSGPVESISGGSLSVMGVAIATSTGTSLEDRSSQGARNLKLTDLRTGDQVEIRGNQSGGSKTLDASLIIRGKPEAHANLQGIAVDVAAPNFTVLGVRVMTNAQTRFQGAGSAAEFFGRAANQAVKVRGTLTGDVLIADQVNIAMEVGDAPANTAVKVIWFGPEATKVGEETKSVTTGEKYLAFTAKDTKMWPKGDYRAEVQTPGPAPGGR